MLYKQMVEVCTLGHSRENLSQYLSVQFPYYSSFPFTLFYKTLSKNIEAKIHKSIILPLVLCGCETRSLTLREERRLRVFENGVLMRVLGRRGTR